MPEDYEAHIDAPASSSHEPASKPRWKVVPVFIFTSGATAPCRKRFGAAILRAKNDGDLITADHEVSAEDVNLETIIDMQSWCRIWPPNGSSRVRAKEKLPREQKRAYETSWSRRGNPESFTLTSPQNLAKLVKIYPGIIVRQKFTVQRQMVLPKKWYAEDEKMGGFY